MFTRRRRSRSKSVRPSAGPGPAASTTSCRAKPATTPMATSAAARRKRAARSITSSKPQAPSRITAKCTAPRALPAPSSFSERSEAPPPDVAVRERGREVKRFGLAALVVATLVAGPARADGEAANEVHLAPSSRGVLGAWMVAGPFPAATAGRQPASGAKLKLVTSGGPRARSRQRRGRERSTSSRRSMTQGVAISSPSLSATLHLVKSGRFYLLLERRRRRRGHGRRQGPIHARRRTAAPR